MAVVEELYRMGIPKGECDALAKKLIDAAAASGYPNALDSILSGVRFLIGTHGPKASPEPWATLFRY